MEAYRKSRTLRGTSVERRNAQGASNRAEVLRGRKFFDHLFTNANRISSRRLQCLYARSARNNDTSSSIRFGAIVGRGIRRAVDRNRIKRLIRESYRCNQHILKPRTPSHSIVNGTIDLIIIYRPPKVDSHRLPTFHEINNEVMELLQKVATDNLWGE